MKNLSDFLLRITRKLYCSCDKWLNPAIASKSDYIFCDRIKGYRHLLIILAGYQPYYFDAVFERVKRAKAQFNVGLDICVCASGCSKAAGKILERICQEESWSFLYLKKNRVTQIQNTAISLHPHAEWIFKMDEDIILPNDYFGSMMSAYRKADDELPYTVGLLAPVININAFGTPLFLKRIGKWDEFQSKFGKYKVGGMWGTPEDHIHRDEKWAEYIWRNSVPFDKVASIFIEDKEIAICPIRMSIGAILFKRSFLEQNGWFPVFRQGGMGADEKFLCDVCVEGMYCMAVAMNIFVGHLGFGPQKEACRSLFKEQEAYIRLLPSNTV